MPQSSLLNFSSNSEAQRALQLFHLIAEATAPVTGEDFFKVLLKHGAAALSVQCAFITECLDYPQTRVRMLAQWLGDAFVDNEEYPLAGTSCEDVIVGGKVCFIAKGAQALYKNEPGVEGYFGIPLFDNVNHRVIGHLAFLDEGEMIDDPLAQSILRIFSARAAVELQRLHAEEKARQLLDELAHVSRLSALGEMASALAHEVNQPLTAIIGYAQACLRMLQARVAEQGEIHHALQRMVMQAEAAGAVIRHLRSLVRKDAPSVSVNVCDSIHEVIGLMNAYLRAQQVAVRLECNDALPQVWANPVQIQQVIVNLIKNSVEAINAAERNHKQVVINATCVHNLIEISVEDNGIGLPQQVEKIFDPFVTAKPDGLGIGLSISRSIIEAHGGRLWAEPGAQGGARICFSLPVGSGYAQTYDAQS